MSMTEVIKEISGKDFSEFMNEPLWNGEAEILQLKNEKWVCCPFCHKKLIKVLLDTKIHKMPYICKSSKCKKSFIVNVE